MATSWKVMVAGKNCRAVFLWNDRTRAFAQLAQARPWEPISAAIPTVALQDPITGDTQGSSTGREYERWGQGGQCD